MEFPAGFDPKDVTRLTLNRCYFNSEKGLDDAFIRLSEVFPNAERAYMLFEDEEMRDVCILEIEPRPDLNEEEFYALTVALAAPLSRGERPAWLESGKSD